MASWGHAFVDQEGKTASMWQAVSDLDACTQHPQYGAMMAKLANAFPRRSRS